MPNLQVIENQSDLWSEIIPELRVDENGEGYASINAAAVLFGITRQTLFNHFNHVSLKPSKLARTLMENGFSDVSLEGFSKTGIPSEAMHIICCYYAMLAPVHNRTEEAVFLSLKMGAKTWRMAIQELTGYEPPNPTPEPAPLPPAEEPKALPSDEVAELRGMVTLLRDEVRILTERYQDLSGFNEFLCGKYHEFQKELAVLKANNTERSTNNPAQLRSEIKEMINAVAFEQDSDHRVLWGKLYQAFQHTYGVCPEPESGESRLDAFMRHDLVGPLHRVARLLFGCRAS